MTSPGERSPRRLSSNLFNEMLPLPMKVPIFLFVLSCTVVGLNAQDAAPATVDLQAEPKSSPVEAPEVPVPSSVVPELPELSKLDQAFNQTSNGKAADESRARIEIRSIQNRIANDPDIVASKEYASGARTDLEKRDRLRSYYQLAYGRMRKFTSSENTRKALNDDEAAHLKMLDQPRVRPAPGGTIPPVQVKSKTEKKKKARLGRVTGT